MYNDLIDRKVFIVELIFIKRIKHFLRKDINEKGDNKMKIVICKQCGSVNFLGEIPETGDIVPSKTSDNLDWFIPMQRKVLDDGRVVYLDQEGTEMTREQYIENYYLDPEIAHKKMKHHIGVYLKD